ncbi:MAG: hypothetical protein ACJ8J0_07465 [Longimicrobiaceae bacterium]
MKSILALLLTLAAPLAARAQGGWTMEVNTTQRWMNGRQRPAFTVHERFRDRLRVDSAVAGAAGGRTLFVSTNYPDAHAVYAHDASGRPLRVEAELEPQSREPNDTPRDSADAVRWRLMREGERSLALPAARVWELVPTFPAAAPARGLRWSDTLALEARHGGYRQTLSGRRVSRVVKDTLVRGRRLWIVRDSAEVRYAETAVLFERTLDAEVTVERTTAGRIVGRHLYDPRLRLFTRRHDSTALAGQAVLRYPDGRAFPTPTRFERVRDWALYDSAGFERHDHALADSADDAGMGPVQVLEENGIEMRLIRGDRRLRDSVVAAWHRSRDPEERARLNGLPSGDPADPPGRWAALALEAGDTAYAVADAMENFYSTFNRPVTEAQLRLLLPFMDDPGLAFAFGLDRDPPYENARQGLLSYPPAITPDSLEWACTRAACALLARQRTEAREPRLRDLGVVAELAFDPARWADTVRARVAAGSVLLRDADLLVRGVAASGRSSSKAPLPGPEAGWRAWLEWMEGRDPTYVPYTADDTGWHVYFAEGHANVIRFHQAMTGRDVVAELRRKRAEATEDSARLVYGAILLGMGERLRTPQELAAAIRTGTPAERELALREVPGLFTPTTRAAPAVAAAIADTLLAMVVDGAPAWPSRDPAAFRGSYGLRHNPEGPRPAWIEADSLPGPVRAHWASRAHLIVDGEKGPPPRTAAITFRVSPVLQVGPFVRVEVRWSADYARRPDQAQAAALGGTSVILMEKDGGWVVISQGEWIT